jgi:hypothetical protein
LFVLFFVGLPGPGWLLCIFTSAVKGSLYLCPKKEKAKDSLEIIGIDLFLVWKPGEGIGDLGREVGGEISWVSCVDVSESDRLGVD